ncbi:hypothetical protein [Nocardioides sp.]|uniref:hypothetical protein n=1 Tax=Nocardioides sp. TaxID=35761 RepID=UPI003783846A
MAGEGWYRRVVPVSALGAGTVAALALLVPGVRDQLALSATHQQQEYVALAFAPTPAGTVAPCGPDRSGRAAGVRVAFDVGSELAGDQVLRYVLTVGPHRHTGTVATRPGEVTRVTRVLPRPHARTWPVVVRLPEAGRVVHARCGGDRTAPR